MWYNSNHWNCVDDNDYNVGVIYWSIFALSRVFDFLEQINPHSSPHAAYRIPSCKLWEGKRNERLHMIEWLLVFAVLFESRVKYLFMAMNSNLTLLGVSFNLLHNFSFSFYHFLMYSSIRISYILISITEKNIIHSYVHWYFILTHINSALWRRRYFQFFVNFSTYTKMINCWRARGYFKLGRSKYLIWIWKRESKLNRLDSCFF